ncbi:MAG: 4a-hydroxytetrahydrobiopterin dehydratase [Bacteroidota bacterium]
MADLSEKECVPCKGDTPPLQGKELKELHQQLSDEWNLVDDHHLTRDYTFDDFQEALDFTNRVGEMSEEQGHHPEIYLTWGKVTLKVYTHAIDGLAESDFIWAAKAEDLY